MKPLSATRRKMRKVNAHQCPAYVGPKRLPRGGQSFMGPVQGIRSSEYLDYARELVSLPPDETDQSTWDPAGWCERPRLDIFVSAHLRYRYCVNYLQSFDFVLSPNGKSVPEDLSPNLLKLGVLSDGFIINNITGIRTQIVKRLDGKGYDISKGEHRSRCKSLTNLCH